MLCESLLGKGFEFGSWPSVVGVRIDGDSTTRGEQSRDLYVFGIHKGNEVLHDFIDAVLMEITVVAEAK